MIEIPKFGYRAAKMIDSSDLFTMSSASFSNFPVKLQGLEKKAKIELFSLHTTSDAERFTSWYLKNSFKKNCK